ncbi:MAG: TadE/TadG family type IV pilus assembly protein [Pseudomonadota bacterium]
MIRPLRKLTHCTGGAAAVEFAIVSVVFISFLVAIVDFGRTMYVKNQLSYLADQATRTVLLNPAIADTALETTMRDDFNAGTAADLTVTITSDTVGGETFKVMTISYPMTLFIPILSSKSLELDVTRRVPVT